MRPVIYVDVLLCVNFFIDCMLLYISGRIAGGRLSRSRMCLGAVVGAVDSLVLLLPDIGRFFSLINTVAAAGLMSLTAYGIKDRRRLARGYMWLMLTTLCYGGLMTALWLYVSPPALTVTNGVVYVDISPLMLIGGTVICYAVMSVGARIAKRKNEINSVCSVRVTFREMSVEGQGLIDTGNLLKEPFSGYPVLIAERAFVEPILDDEFVYALDGKGGSNVRVIPYSSVGGKGVIFAFRPDFVEIEADGERYECDKVYIGVLKSGKVSSSASIIINPDILE